MSETALIFLKIVFLVVFLLYAIFTLVVFNQVRTMNRVVTELHSSTILAIVAFLNVVVALSLFVYALVIL